MNITATMTQQVLHGFREVLDKRKKNFTEEIVKTEDLAPFIRCEI